MFWESSKNDSMRCCKVVGLCVPKEQHHVCQTGCVGRTMRFLTPSFEVNKLLQCGKAAVCTNNAIQRKLRNIGLPTWYANANLFELQSVSKLSPSCTFYYD